MNEEIIFETTLKEISEGMAKAYENWAKKAGYNITNKTVLDCKKVEISKEIDEYLWKYYRDKTKEKNKRIELTEEDLAMFMLSYEPKVNEKLKSWTVKISEGFAIECENEWLPVEKELERERED